MHTGMLWFDDDPAAALSVKIQKAAQYYRKKYGRLPDLCLVHPGMLDEKVKRLEVDKLIVRPYRPILPGHLWIGVEDRN